MKKATNDLRTILLNEGMNVFTPIYQTVVDASTKTVTVEVETEALRKLKDGDYKMCFAKKVGDANYNVVWQAYGKFMEYNEFSWVPSYSVFGTNTFKDSVKVKATCKPVSIGLGETTTLDKDGVLSTPISGGSTTSITMVNDYGSIHAGVNQLCTGLDGKEQSTPIYVAEKAALSGNIELHPKEKVLIWFEQDIETGTMFSNARSRMKEVDLTNSNVINLHYNGEWFTV